MPILNYIQIRLLLLQSCKAPAPTSIQSMSSVSSSTASVVCMENTVSHILYSESPNFRTGKTGVRVGMMSPKSAFVKNVVMTRLAPVESKRWDFYDSDRSQKQ